MPESYVVSTIEILIYQLVEQQDQYKLKISLLVQNKYILREHNGLDRDKAIRWMTSSDGSASQCLVVRRIHGNTISMQIV